MSQSLRASNENLHQPRRRPSSDQRRSPNPLRPTNMASFGPSEFSNQEGPPNRRRRQLPQLNNIRKAHSISFLPSVGNDNSKRRLPDPAQGRLLPMIQAELRKESTLRLTVVKELREEKQKRWELEDVLHKAKTEAKQAKKEVFEVKQACSQLTQELNEERACNASLQQQLQDYIQQLEMAHKRLKEQEISRKFENEEHQEAENQLTKVYESLRDEQRKRAQTQSQLKVLVDMIESRQPGATQALFQQAAQESPIPVPPSPIQPHRSTVAQVDI